MENISYPVLDASGKEVGTVDLDPRVFGVEPKPWLVHETVRWQLARKRAGTHATLNRSRMQSGSGAKPFRQKGTGRARAGSKRSPIWVGGAVTFGPQPRSYDFRLPKRTRRQALASVLSDKVANKKLLVLDRMEAEGGKTRVVAKMLKDLGADGKKVLLVADGGGETFARAARNIPKVFSAEADGVNVYDLMNHEFFVVSKDDIASLQKRVLQEKTAEEAQQ